MKAVLRLTTRIGLLLLLAGVVIFSVLRFSPQDFFKVSIVQCKTQFGPCAQKDEERIEQFKGVNLFALSSASVEEKLKENFRNRKVFVEKVFPNTIVIALEKRKPVVSFVPENFDQEGVFLVDQDGVIIDFVDSSPLPVIITEEIVKEWVVGENVGEKGKRAVNIVYPTHMSFGIESARLQKDVMYISLEDSLNIHFPLDRDPQLLVGALQLILARSKIEGKLPTSIDLRYSNPVLRY